MTRRLARRRSAASTSIFLTDGTATRTLAFAGRTIDYHDVQAATLAAQADGFSTLADVSTVRASLAEAQGY